MLVEIVLVLVLVVLLLQTLKKPSGLPPGRWGLPLVGYIPLSKKSIEQQLMDLQKEHGDIYLWRMGTQVMVFIHDYKIVREAFLRPEFVDRPNWFLFNFGEKKTLGVIGSSGLTWHNNRRFSLRQLRDQGMGKSRLVTAVQDQAALLLAALDRQAGKQAHIPHTLNVAIINILWQMIGSTQFKEDDPRLKQFRATMDSVMESLGPMAFVDFMPWLVNLFPSFISKKLFKLDLIDKFQHEFFAFFQEVTDEHRATLDPDNPRDLIDGYLLEEEERKNDLDNTFHDRDLLFVLADLFFAGLQTTHDTFTYLLYYLATFPHVQRKMQEELDRVLQDDQLPTMEIRPQLPYLEAVLHETLRYSSLASVGVQHLASEDTHLGGYKIPKGSVISAMVVGIHLDPRYWEDSQTFRPERWLDEGGKFTTKKEGFLPFGIGKRQCIGEGLARMELYVFAATVFQKLNVAPPPGKTIDLSHDPGNPFGHTPLRQELIFTRRQ